MLNVCKGSAWMTQELEVNWLSKHALTQPWFLCQSVLYLLSGCCSRWWLGFQTAKWYINGIFPYLFPPFFFFSFSVTPCRSLTYLCIRPIHHRLGCAGTSLISWPSSATVAASALQPGISLSTYWTSSWIATISVSSNCTSLHLPVFS